LESNSHSFDLELSGTEQAVVRRIIAGSDREHPADATLKTELQQQRGIRPYEKRLISQIVFAFYRWFGWVDVRQSLDQQVQQTSELDSQFQQQPESLSDEALTAKAVPAWVWDQSALNPAWTRALQMTPKIWLRARLGKRESLAGELGDCVLPPATSPCEAVQYVGAKNLYAHPLFHGGEFELQDLSSQMVSLICNPQPGQVWWDVCAGEGGKTLHLADLMQNQGLIWATDRASWRLRNLKRRAARARIFNYRFREWQGNQPLPFKTRFDGVLVDAPCTGLGTWHRNPHARWVTGLQDVTELAAIQKRLLFQAASAVKPGGSLVYSVCTITRAETTEVAEAFAKEFGDFKPRPVPHPLKPNAASAAFQWFWPQETGGNGMFVAAWSKV